MDTRNDVDGIDINKILHMILRKWFVVVISLILFASAAAFVLLYLMEDKYEAFTTIFVYNEEAGTQNEIYTQIITNEKLVKDYRIIAKSNRVVSRVQKNLPGIKVNPANISVEAEPDTRVLKLRIRDVNPYNAASIANETTRVLIEEAKEITNITNISVIDDALVPAFPVSTPVELYIILSALAGALAGVGIILVMDLFDNTIKDPQDITEKFDIPILALIPQFDPEDMEQVEYSDYDATGKERR